MKSNPSEGPNRMSPVQIRVSLAAVLGALTLFRLYYIGQIPISEDEAYYWQWSRQLEWGYYDQGPLVAYTIKLGTLLLGDTLAGIRFGAVLGSLALSLLVFRCASRIYGDQALGLALVLAVNSTILFSAGAVIHTYDTPQAFFWFLCCYLVARAVFQNAPLAWYGAGAALGLALLSKYSSLFIPLLVFGFLLMSTEHRRWLGRKEPWLAILIAFLVFLPNLVWNYNHGWATILFNLDRAGHDWNFTSLEFLGGQAGLIGPVWFVFLVWGVVLAWRQAKQGDTLQAFWLWTSLPVLAFFLLLSAKTRVQPNWTAPAYLTAALAAAYAIKPKIAASQLVRRWALIGLVSSYLILIPIHWHAPLINFLGVDPDMDPTNKMYGWSTLGQALDAELEKSPAGQNPFIFSTRHQIASLAAFYATGQPRTHGLFLPGTKRSSYVHLTEPAKLKGRDALAVGYGEDGLERLFAKVTRLDDLELKNQYGRTYHRLRLYRCEDFKGYDFR